MGEAEERKSPVGSKGQCPDDVNYYKIMLQFWRIVTF